MAQPRKARAGLAFIYGIVGFSLIGLLAIVLRARQGAPAADAYEEKRAEGRRAHLAEIQKVADEKLNAAPSWVNKEKGIVRIPITDAMAIVAKELAAKEVKATDVKAEITPTIVTPPYLQAKSEDKAENQAEGEGAETPGTEGTVEAEEATTGEESTAPEAAPAEANPEAAAEPAAEGENAPAAPVAEETPAETAEGEAPAANPGN